MTVEIITILLFLIMLIASVTLVCAFTSLAPWVPTPTKDLKRVNRLADLKDGNIFYEIGCGTAIVSMFIAKNNPEARVIGVELALPVYLAARFLTFFQKADNLQIEFGDALRKDFSGADVVYIYGLPKTVNGKLKEKMEAELKPGAKFISYAFALNCWKGSRSRKDKLSSQDASIYIYVK